MECGILAHTLFASGLVLVRLCLSVFIHCPSFFCDNERECRQHNNAISLFVDAFFQAAGCARALCVQGGLKVLWPAIFDEDRSTAGKMHKPTARCLSLFTMWMSKMHTQQGLCPTAAASVEAASCGVGARYFAKPVHAEMASGVSRASNAFVPS